MAPVTEDLTVRLAIGPSMVAGGDGVYPVFNPAHPDEVVLAAPAASPGPAGRRSRRGPVGPGGLGGIGL